MGSRDWRLGIWIYVSATDDDYQESVRIWCLWSVNWQLHWYLEQMGHHMKEVYLEWSWFWVMTFPKPLPKVQTYLFFYSLQSSNFVDEVANFLPFPGWCCINSNLSKVNDVRGFSACLFIACHHHDSVSCCFAEMRQKLGVQNFVTKCPKFWPDCYILCLHPLSGADEAIMAASHCHSWCMWWSVTDIHKVMTTLILVVFLLVWPEQTQYFSGVFLCNHADVFWAIPIEPGLATWVR